MSVSRNSETRIEQGHCNVTLVFPGSAAFQEWTRRSSEGPSASKWFSSVSVFLDGESVGSGDGYEGFRISFDTTLGVHDISFQWEQTIESGSISRDTPYRSDLCVSIEQGANVTLRLGMLPAINRFYLRHTEPKMSARGLLTTSMTIWLFAGGLVAFTFAAFLIFN
jgi:hypothetical protein